MISRIECRCGNHLAIHHAAFQPIQDADWHSEGWERVGGAWTCWQCLGKPMPRYILDAIRGRELDELDQETDREDCLDFLDRLEPPFTQSKE